MVILPILLHVAIQGGLIIRVLLKRGTEPATRVAWILVILMLPVIGIAGYVFIGEINIGRRNSERMNRIRAEFPDPETLQAKSRLAIADMDDQIRSLFQAGESVNGFKPVTGNRARLMDDSDSAINSMVADIDSSRETVHLIFYIWLTDRNGLKMVDALKRAAQRGVTCRVLVDAVGSRELVRSSHWSDMRHSGVKTATALPISYPLLRALIQRIDLRDHRKILIIDNRITYCGSQNCADPAFLPKAKFAPWVDLMLRVEGPVVMQNQMIFAADWMTYCDEDIRRELSQPERPPKAGFAAQVVATGPNMSRPAMPEMFQTLIFSAREKLMITTPYYAPTQGLQSALCAAAHRGIDTTIIFPQRNDNFTVAATSRSYYRELLSAGVKVHEYGAGLLHAKTITIDSDITFIGSANMDHRSFDLNFENNMLIQDRAVTGAIQERQKEFLSQSRLVTAAEVEAWPWRRRLLQNALAIVSPLI